MKRAVSATVVAAVAIISAPVAGATPDGTRCGKRGGASVCQKPGHSSVHSQPAPLPAMPSGTGLFRPAWAPGYGVPSMPVVD